MAESEARYNGSEPTALALADDGRSLYVALDGAATVGRFDTVSSLKTAEFPLGSDPFSGPFYARTIPVAPGAPDTILVARYNKQFIPSGEGVAVYDFGVARPTATSTFPPLTSVAFGATATTAFAYDGETGPNSPWTPME